MTSTLDAREQAHGAGVRSELVGRSGFDASPSRRPWRFLLISFDTGVLALSFLVGSALRGHWFGRGEGPTLVTMSVAHELPYLVAYMVAMSGYGVYRRSARRVQATSFFDLGRFLHGLLVGAIITLFVSGLLNRWFGAPRLGWVEVSFMSVPAVLLLPLGRAVSGLVVRHTGAVRSRILVVGSGPVADGLVRRLSRFSDVQVVGMVDDGAEDVHGEGCLADVPALCRNLDADRVLVTFSSNASGQLSDLIRELPDTVKVCIVPRLFDLVTWQTQVEEIHGVTVMDVPPATLGLVQRSVKRSMDLLGGGILLLLVSPLLAAIAIAVRLGSPGPVFFRQDRVGRRNQVFRIFKFRTMSVDADGMKIDLRERNEVDGPLFKIRDDPRVTKIGGFLRRTSLDEIPQLINVVLGDMSLVGPRPFVPHESAGIDGWAARRFEVRPGMTGLWQVSGRNDLPFEELRQLDYAYVASWSIWWDLKILWHTPGSVFGAHGAY